MKKKASKALDRIKEALLRIKLWFRERSEGSLKPAVTELELIMLSHRPSVPQMIIDFTKLFKKSLIDRGSHTKKCKKKIKISRINSFFCVSS